MKIKVQASRQAAGCSKRRFKVAMEADGFEEIFESINKGL